MLFRALRHRGSIKKVGQKLLRPVLYGIVSFIGALIVWKFLIGTLHMLGVLAEAPGLRLQYLVPVAVGVGVLTWRLIRDLVPASPASGDQ
jgi:hypothetical protein